MAKASNTFKKTERLKSRKAIEYLFRHGKSHSVPPFRMIYNESRDQDFPVLMTVSVPKRLIRNAVERNLIKRRTREAYRLHKPGLYEDAIRMNKQFRVLFIYQAEQTLDYRSIEKSVRVLLRYLERTG